MHIVYSGRTIAKVCLWLEGKRKCLSTNFLKEREFDWKEYIILTLDLAVQQRVHRMDEYYCYLIVALVL